MKGVRAVLVRRYLVVGSKKNDTLKLSEIVFDDEKLNMIKPGATCDFPFVFTLQDRKVRNYPTTRGKIVKCEFEIIVKTL